MVRQLGIRDLLDVMGLDTEAPIRLVRHQDSRYDVHELQRNGWLEAYQGFQSKPVFESKYIVTFVGATGTRARLIGIYEVLDRLPAQQGEIPKDCPYQVWKQDSKYFYKLARVHGFEDLEGRVIIEWGKGTRTWSQHLSNKRVVEILPGSAVVPIFRDYQEFVLTHRELERVFSDPEAHREWRAQLSAVAGVYLIVASTDGAQYVGSAYGEAGVWGRWAEYAKNGHGGNHMLRELIENDPRYPEAFRYSLLQILPKSQTQAEVLEWERVCKDKLGTRTTGLNLN